jgi:hypothetical protein
LIFSLPGDIELERFPQYFWLFVDFLQEFIIAHAQVFVRHHLFKQLISLLTEISDANCNVWYRIIPVIFVFDREQSFELLALQFHQHRIHLAYALAPDYIVLTFEFASSLTQGRFWGNIFKMKAFQPPFIFFQSLNRIDTHTFPMSNISTTITTISLNGPAYPKLELASTLLSAGSLQVLIQSRSWPPPQTSRPTPSILGISTGGS